MINGTGERKQHGEEVSAVLRYLVTAIGRPTNLKDDVGQIQTSVSWP